MLPWPYTHLKASCTCEGKKEDPSGLPRGGLLDCYCPDVVKDRIGRTVMVRRGRQWAS